VFANLKEPFLLLLNSKNALTEKTGIAQLVWWLCCGLDSQGTVFDSW